MNLPLVTLVAASFAAVVPGLHAQNELPPAFAAAVVSESKTVTPARFPNADTVVLSSEQRTEVNADGGYIRRSTVSTKAVTEKGRRELLSFETGFNVSYGYAKVTALDIIKADGRVVSLDPEKQSAVQQDPSSMEMNIYDPNDKRLVVAIPGVEIGDTVRISLEEGEPKPRMKGCFADITTFEGTQPALRTKLVVVTPKSLPLARIAIKGGDANGIAHTKTEKGDTIEYAWEAGETPQVIPEPGMPALHLCVRRLLVSTVPDWQTISKWYYDISEPHFTVTPDIKAKAEALVNGIADREQRIRAVYKFVSQEIRYMGIISETGAPGYEPHDVSLTFDKRYGVCRDKAALLTVMLRAAGFEAYPVLISAGGNHLDDEVPAPYFNHAITALKEDDGSWRLLDSTDENTKDTFPAYLSNCSFLVASPKGDSLRVSKVPDASQHMLTGETKLVVRKDGTVTGECLVNFGGINDTYYRGGLAQAKPDDIRRFVESRVAAVLPGARVAEVSLEPSDLKDTTKPMRLRMTFTATDFFTSRDGKAFIRTPFVAQVFGFVAQQLGEVTGLDKRRFPIKLDIICGVHETVSITLPDTVHETLALPADKNLDTTGLAYSRSLRRDGDKLTGTFDLRLKKLDVPAAEYGVLRDAVREMSRAGKRVALFATDSEVKPDSHVLSSKTVVNITDAHTMTVSVAERRKVLTYAGMKDNAELKLGWNSTNPEPQLDRAVVTDAAGATHTVEAKEINILDDGWVASAPRYAPSRVKVIALPKVEVGSVIDTAYTTTYRNLAAISWREIFSSTDAVDADELEIVAPASLPLYLENRAGAKVVREGDRVRITVLRKLLPVPREPSTAPGKNWAPTVALSSLRNESAYAAIIRDALAGKADPDASVRAKATALTEGIAGDAGRIVALRNFVSKDIRQAGPGWGEIPAGYLSGAARTLADGYGSAADRQLLFTALLRAAGYEATPALYATNDLAIATRRAGEPFSPGLFGSLGTRLRLKGGDIDFAFLSQYADWRQNAGAGDLALPLDTGVSVVVTTAPDSSRATYAVTLEESGDASVDFSSVSKGNGATGFNAWAAEVTPEQLDRHFQSVVTGLSRDAVLVGKPVLKPGVEAGFGFSARVADFAVMQGKFAYFDLPGGSGEIFGGAGESSRRLPYAVSGNSDQTVSWSVVLPKGWKLAGDPVEVSWEGPAGVGRVSLRVVREPLASGETRLTWTRTVALRAAVVPPEAYPALVELNRRMKSPDTWRVLLEKE